MPEAFAEAWERHCQSGRLATDFFAYLPLEDEAPLSCVLRFLLVVPLLCLLQNWWRLRIRTRQYANQCWPHGVGVDSPGVSAYFFRLRSEILIHTGQNKLENTEAQFLDVSIHGSGCIDEGNQFEIVFYV